MMAGIAQNVEFGREPIAIIPKQGVCFPFA
jgi:hypothetical protein